MPNHPTVVVGSSQSSKVTSLGMRIGKKKQEIKTRTKPKSAVEDVLLKMSMADSTSSKLEKSIPDPAKHQIARSKMHEVEMDENIVVKHTRRDSTAVGVTPSDPSAIVDLFLAMDSMGSIRVPEDSETGSTTGEGEENSEHLAQASGPTSESTATRKPDSSTASLGSSVAVTSSGAGAGSSNAADTSASLLATGSIHQHHEGPVHKLFGHNKAPAGQSPRTEVPGSSSQAAPPVFQPAPTPGAHQERDDPPPPYREIDALVSAGAGGAAVMLGGAEEMGQGKVANGYTAAEARRVSGFGAVKRAEGAWQLSAEESQQTAVSGDPSVQAKLPPPPAPAPASSIVVPPAQHVLVNPNDGDVSLSQAPLRRKTSMGSFQRGMGESLTGRLRKQLDIPREPKVEVNLNIPIDQIQCLKYLAQGAMCVAYTALVNGKQVVLKTPLPDTSHAEVAANDLEVEMLLLKELYHDNIVSLLGAGYLPDGRRFVALEYLSGGTLSTVLRNRGPKPLGISKVLDLSLALCNALEYLHDVAVPGRIVCHRDLKPDNIGFAADGTLKLIDFGLGKIIKRRFRVRAEKYHMTGGTGSLRYMAPEIADHQEYNEKGDVYSFSLIMWEMLAGVKPFLGLKRPDFYSRVVDKGERPTLDPEWPLHVRNLLESCWRTNLDERLSFREVAGILKVCAEEENQRCFTEEKRKSIKPQTRRPRLWTTTGVRSDLQEISADPQYKPKFKISSFFSHSTGGGVTQAVERLKKGSKAKKGVRRVTSNNT